MITYKIFDRNSMAGTQFNDLELYLNDLAAQGWEIVSFSFCEGEWAALGKRHD